MTRLKSLGIPTVYIDRKMDGDVVSVIKTNNFAAGELAGKEMVKRLKGSGRVAIFRLSPDIVSTSAREAGFIKQVRAAGLKIVLDQYLSGGIGTGRVIAQQVLQERDDIDAIFTPNETTSLSVLKVLQKLNRAGEIMHIGFDSNKHMIQSLRNGHMQGFVIQRPYLMGYMGVNTVYDAMRGAKVAPSIETPASFISIENIHELTGSPNMEEKGTD